MISFKSVVFLAAVLFLSACLPGNASNDSILVQIADTKFNIPREYFVKRLPIPQNNSSVRAVGLVMMWPDFSSTPRTDQEIWDAGEMGNHFRVDILDASQNISVEQSIWNAKHGYEGNPNAADYFAGEFYGLEKWTGEPPKERDFDVYVFDSDALPKGFLRCSKKTRTRPIVNPICSGRFREKKIAYTISFRAEQLPNWPAISEKMFNRINKFKVTNTQ